MICKHSNIKLLLSLIFVISLFGAYLAAIPIHMCVARQLTCEKKLALHPNEYASARCFYERGKRNGRREAEIQELRALIKTKPSLAYLKVVLGHFYWTQDPDQALRHYEEAWFQFNRSNNTQGSLISLSNQLKLLSNLGRREEATPILTRLSRMAQSDLPWETRAQALIASEGYRINQQLNMDSALEKLDSIPTRVERLLPIRIRIDLVTSRGDAASQLLAFPRARREYRRLAEIADDLGDLSLRAHALYEIGGTFERALHLKSSARMRRRAQAATEQALKAAQLAGRGDLEMMSLDTLAVLAMSSTQHRERAREYLNACIAKGESHAFKGPIGVCLARFSQVVSSSDPELALHQAKRAMQLLSESGTIWQRVVMWQHLTRRLWEHSNWCELKWAAQGLVNAIESYRRVQSEALGQRRVFAPWAAEYSWLAHRIDKGPKINGTSQIEAILALADQSRARGLRQRTAQHERSVGLSLPQGERHALDELSKLWSREASTPNAQRCYAQFLRDLPTTLSEAASESVQKFNLEKLWETLDPDEALVSIVASPDKSIDGESNGKPFAVVVHRGRAEVVRLSASESQLSLLVKLTRRALLSEVETELVKTKDRIRQAMNADELLNAIGRSARIIVVADGVFHHLPFSTILGGRNHALQQSIRHWMDLQGLSTPEEAKALAIVDPSLGHSSTKSLKPGDHPHKDQLRNSRKESDLIRRSLDEDVQELFGRRATAANIEKSWTRGHNLLHVAAHTNQAQEIDDAPGVLLYDASSETTRPWTTKDISGLRFDGALVVLAGCSTAQGRVLNGEGSMTVARSFQQSGARTVIASLWPVRDRSTLDFFELLYRRIGRGESIGEAVAQTRRDARDRGYSASMYEAFVVLGDSELRFRSRDIRTSNQSIPWSIPEPWALGGPLFVVAALYRARRESRLSHLTRGNL